MPSTSQPPGPPPPVPAREAFVTATGYAVLFLFGLLQGLTGSVQFSRGIGPVPLAAICFAVAIGLTSALCGRGTGSPWGAVLPSAGWFVASFAMALPQKSGSVMITNTAAGQIYLYGGAVCAAIGTGVGLSGRTRRTRASRG